MKKNVSWTLAWVATAALVACGGGGGSDEPATPSSVTMAGTAAKGAALADAAVSIKCAAGSGSATTASDGTYSVTISEAHLPCALAVVGTEGSVFHAVVPGSGGGSFTANITPLTEMVVAQLAGAAPATFFSGFGSGSTVSAASLTQAIAYIKTALAGITDLGTANPLSDALVIGNPLDQKIDAVMAALAAGGLTLAEVSAAIVANPSAPSVVAAPLAPAATECAWFKSGNYRMINPYETDPQWKAHVLAIDADAKTFTDQDGVTGSFISDEGCQYTIDAADEPDFTNKVMVSSGGVLMIHSQSMTDPAQRSVAIGLPEQTLPLSEFAGTWNLAGWDPASGIPTPGFIAQTDEVTFDANGQMTAAGACVGTAACTVETAPFASFATNAAGGFHVVEDGVNTGRVFLFKTLAGKAVWVAIADDGQFTVATRKETLGALPAVGSVTNFHEYALNGNGTISDLTENSVTVTATDPTANTITRIRASDSRVDTYGVDYPRTGVRHRAQNTCSINGAPSNCSQVVQVPLQGMGITLSLSVGLTNPATAFYNVSIGKPTN